jgi:hypothetical protein
VPDRVNSAPLEDLAAEVERGRTVWTPFRALAGVWLVVALVVALVIAVIVLVLSLY